MTRPTVAPTRQATKAGPPTAVLAAVLVTVVAWAASRSPGGADERS